jgi:hypothetical protein
MLVRVQAFGETHKDTFPDGSVGGQAFAAVDRLEAIARTARLIAQTPPGFDDPFRVTRLRSDQALVTAGRVFGREAERAKATFVAHNLPESFVVELPGLIDTLDNAIRGRDAGKVEQTAAQAGIDAALASGLAAVRKLNIHVRNAFHADRVTSAVWNTQRRLGRVRRARTPVAVSPAPASDQPAAAPAKALEPAVDLKEAS